MQIGVTGHRQPPKLPDDKLLAIQGSVAAIIGALDTFGPGRRLAVSSLAEGADRIVAETALKAGWQLKAILPFAQAEYEKDFSTPGSLDMFRRLLENTYTVVQLPGFPSERPRAYQAAGLTMLEQLDLLIAIWDGKPSNGIGGSAEIVAAAVERSIPVAWIKPSSPHDVHLAEPAWQRPSSLHEAFVSTTAARIAVTMAKR
jgi:hypothetical protein